MSHFLWMVSSLLFLFTEIPFQGIIDVIEPHWNYNQDGDTSIISIQLPLNKYIVDEMDPQTPFSGVDFCCLLII